MAIEFVASATASASNESFLGVPHPSGTQTGDFVLMIVRSWGYTIRDMGLGQVPTDGVVGMAWTKVLENADRGNGHNLYVFSGIAEIGGPAYPNVYFMGAGYHQATILTFRGVDPVNAIDVTATGYAASTISHVTPSVSPTSRARGQGGLLLHVVATQLATGTPACSWSGAASAGIVERTDSVSSAGFSHLSTATAALPTSTHSPAAVAGFPAASWGMTATLVLVGEPVPGARLRLGMNKVPLMLGATTELAIEPSAPVPFPSGGSGGAMADEMGRPYTASQNNFTSTYHRWAGHLDTAKPIGLLVHLHGDGATEYHTPTATSMLGGPNGIVQVAKDRNMLVVCPLTPDTGNVTWWNWSTSNGNPRWLASLIQALCAEYNIDRRRIWFTAHAGGARFLTQYFLPLRSDSVLGGGAIIFSGGDENAASLNPFADSLKARFSMHWLTGLLDDGTEPGGGSANALAAARRGETWYRGQGFVTTLNTPAGQGRDWSGTYGTRVKAILDANII